MEYEYLLYRIRDNPTEHIGRRSVSEIKSYFLGYETAYRFWQHPQLCYRLPRDRFQKWLDDRFHLCRQDMQTLCLLLTENESEAFDLFFEMYDIALEECDAGLSNSPPDEPLNRDRSTKNSTLIRFLFDSKIREKPAMYFGNHRAMSQLWAMCSGFLWAENDIGIESSSDAVNMELFQVWLDDRYPIAKGRTWDRLFDFLCLHSGKWAIEQFYEHLEMFLEGEMPDALSKTTKEIVENVRKHITKENGTG